MRERGLRAAVEAEAGAGRRAALPPHGLAVGVAPALPVFLIALAQPILEAHEFKTRHILTESLEAPAPVLPGRDRVCSGRGGAPARASAAERPFTAL